MKSSALSLCTILLLCQVITGEGKSRTNSLRNYKRKLFRYEDLVDNDYHMMASGYNLNKNKRQTNDTEKVKIQKGVSDVAKMSYYVANTCFDYLKQCTNDVLRLNHTIFHQKRFLIEKNHEISNLLTKLGSKDLIHKQSILEKNTLTKEFQECCENNRKLDEKNLYYKNLIKVLETKLNRKKDEVTSEIKNTSFLNVKLSDTIKSLQEKLQDQKLHYDNEISKYNLDLDNSKKNNEIIKSALSSLESKIKNENELLKECTSQLAKRSLDLDVLAHKTRIVEENLKEEQEKNKGFDDLKLKAKVLKFDASVLQNLKGKCWDLVKDHSRDLYLVDNRYLYFYSPAHVKLSWHEAARKCHTMGMNLVSPHSAKEEDILNQLISHNCRNGNTPGFIWSAYNILSSSKFISYSSSQVYNGSYEGINGECLKSTTNDNSTLRWLREPCTTPEHFICEMRSPCIDLLLDPPQPTIDNDKRNLFKNIN